MFASDVFDAHRSLPNNRMFPSFMFPDHHLLLQRFMGEEPQAQIAHNPGSVEALIVMAIWLDGRKQISSEEGKDTETGSGFMSYHHLLTLISVFHQNLRVRNAATFMAGTVLHADPDEDGRLAILEDLLENCMFPSLQACAVSWLREEIIAARTADSTSRFASPDCFETLQYTLFPSLTYLKEADTPTLWAFWTQNAPLHLQVANFALFLFSSEMYKALIPAGMGAAIEHRYVEPLLHAAQVLENATKEGEVEAEELNGEVLMQLSILADILGRVPLH